MFQRFTDRARRVLVLAQEEAAEMGHPATGVEHLLVGLAREVDGVAGQVLDGLDLSVDKLRTVAQRRLGGEAATPTESLGRLPFTEDAKLAFENALAAALSRSHNYIGTEHLLLGIVKSASPGAQLFDELEIDPAAVITAVDEALVTFAAKLRTMPGRQTVTLNDPTNFTAMTGFEGELRRLGEQFRVVLAENERLRALLAEHGIDADGDAAHAS